jgi:hypothetical protein
VIGLSSLHDILGDKAAVDLALKAACRVLSWVSKTSVVALRLPNMCDGS